MSLNKIGIYIERNTKIEYRKYTIYKATSYLKTILLKNVFLKRSVWMAGIEGDLFLISGVFKRDRTNFIFCHLRNFRFRLKRVAPVASKLIFNHMKFGVLSVTSREYIPDTYVSLHCYSFCYESQCLNF